MVGCFFLSVENDNSRLFQICLLQIQDAQMELSLSSKRSPNKVGQFGGFEKAKHKSFRAFFHFSFSLLFVAVVAVVVAVIFAVVVAVVVSNLCLSFPI